jgi:hypothetical protein
MQTGNRIKSSLKLSRKWKREKTLRKKNLQKYNGSSGKKVTIISDAKTVYSLKTAVTGETPVEQSNSR